MSEQEYTIINITVNGDPYRVEVEPQWNLAYVIRDKLSLTGTKEHCSEGGCGMCTVIIDGRSILSCMTLAVTVDGKSIATVEGLAEGGKLHPIQTAWVEEHGGQCGYCTPGFVMASKALLDKNPNPTTSEIKEAIGGNICRCGNYEFIINSVHAAAEMMKSEN